MPNTWVMATTSTATAATNGTTPKRMASSSSAKSEDSDILARWSQKWKSGSIGFHRPKVHESLLRFENNLLSSAKENNNLRVLVPLCGKTVDMAHFAQMDKVQQVIGIDGISKALEEFANENPHLQIKKTIDDEHTSQGGAFDVWKGSKIELWRGDFFDLEKEGSRTSFDSIWDRAALIAIEPELREKYVDILGAVISPGGRILLSTYVAEKEGGPPYSMDEPLIRELFENKPWVERIEVLSKHDALQLEPWAKSWIMWIMYGNVQEKVFLIQAK